MKVRSASVSLMSRQASSAATIWRDAFSCIARNGLSAAAGLRSAADLLGPGGDRSHQRVAVGKELVLQPQRMELLHPFGQGNFEAIARTTGCAKVR